MPIVQHRVSNPPKGKALLVFDGDCGFCRYWLVKWKKISSDHFDYKPFQEVAGNYKEIPLAEFKSAVQLILPNGNVMSGAEVAYYTYYVNGSIPFLYNYYSKWKIFKILSDSIYSWVAKNREFAFRLTRLIFGKDPYKNSSRRVIAILFVFFSLMFLGIASI